MATTFQYSVRDRGGRLVSGKLAADSQAALVTRLKAMGYAPVSVAETNVGVRREITLPGRKPRVKLKDLAVFSRQFATMINSGLSLLRALTILTEQTENKTLARILGEVRNDIESGSALSVAMGKHPKAFPPLMVNMTKAGEVGGFLDTVMLRIAQNFEADVKLRGKVKAAMTYPVVVFIMAIMMGMIMLIFIVPVFEKMFKDLGSTLPPPTALLVLVSHAMRLIAPLLVIVLVGFALWWKKFKNDPRVRNVVDPLKLKAPVFGQLFRKIALSRFSRNLGTMMSPASRSCRAWRSSPTRPATSCLPVPSGTSRTASAAGSRSPSRWRSTRSSRRWWSR